MAGQFLNISRRQNIICYMFVSAGVQGPVPESSSGNTGAALLAASALTKIHPGAGRSPGVVDLPVIRDPLGYPYIPGSMIKGSLRSALTLRSTHENKDKIIKCLFGPETQSSEKNAGSLTFHDLYPLLIPAPSSTHGVLYVTSPTLLARAAAIARVAGHDGLASSLEELAASPQSGEAAVLASEARGNGETARVGAFTLNINTSSEAGSSVKRLAGLIGENLNPLYKAVHIEGRVLVLSEKLAVPVIESLLARVTRVKINRETKTAESGGLWTEEYLPWGTLFLGLIIDNGFRGAGCEGNPLDDLKALIESSSLKVSKNSEGSTVFRLVLGGKETTGGGLVKAKLVLAGGSTG